MNSQAPDSGSEKLLVYLKRLRKLYISAAVCITLTRNADPDRNFHSDSDTGTDPDLASHFDVEAFHFDTGPDRLHKTMRIRNCTAGLVRNSDNFVRI